MRCDFSVDKGKYNQLRTKPATEPEPHPEDTGAMMDSFTQVEFKCRIFYNEQICIESF